MSTTRPTCRRTSAAPTVRRLRSAEPAQARPEGANRELLAPPSASTAWRTSGQRTGRWVRQLRVTRSRALVMLALSLVVLLGGSLAVGAAATPGSSPFAAQPAPTPSIPLVPVPTGDPCPPDSPLPVCHLPTPTTTPPPTGIPLPIPTGPPTSTPCIPGPFQPPCDPPASGPPVQCTGEGCIPQPPTSAPPTGPGNGQPGQPGGEEDNCGITDIGACITEAIDAFFRGIVTAALNPLLDLLSKTLLTTPTPDKLPRIGELWDNSWQILLACYGMLILIAGVLVMGYQTLQTRHSIKEIAPRIVVGFLAGALSLWVATKGIQIANGLAQAVMGGGLDASSAGETLRNLVLGSLNGGIFIIFIGIFLAGMLIVLLITYIVRVALTVVLIAGAPLALMFHALPHTEGIARWWWKAFGGCLAIQVGQSLTLITAMKVFLAPGGFTLFGPTVSGLVNLLVALALIYILFKIPFWVLSSVKGNGGRSALGSIVRGFIAYKTFGLLGGRGGGGRRSRPSGGGGGRGGNGGGRGPVDPYAHSRTTGDGQYVLPLAGARRSRPAAKSKPAPAPKPKAGQGRQLALPLGDDWPENKPVLGRDGQYRLPLDAERVKPTPPPASPGQPGTGGRRRGGQQLELAFDPYKGNRTNRGGQYPLPLDGVRRTSRPSSPPPPAPPPAAPPVRTRGTQLELPFDPYKGNRATRSGQYPLPLDVRRVRPAKPAPTPPPAARPAPPAGKQLRLPLDLPKPPRRTTPPPKSGGKP